MVYRDAQSRIEAEEALGSTRLYTPTTAYVGTVEDVTESVTVAHQLERVGWAMRSTNDPVLIFDSTGHVEWQNDAASLVSGRRTTAQELIGIDRFNEVVAGPLPMLRYQAKKGVGGGSIDVSPLHAGELRAPR